MDGRPNLVSYLAEFVAADGQTAYVYARGLRTFRMSYRELARAAWRVGRWLRDGETVPGGAPVPGGETAMSGGAGLAAGDRVVLWGSNSGEWAAAFWGCLAAGVVAVPVDAGASAAYVARIVEETGARLLLADGENLARSGGMDDSGAESSPGGGGAGRRAVRKAEIETLLERVWRYGAEPFEAEGIVRETLAQILYTSGSTAAPKGVCLTHGNTLASLEPLEREIARYLRYERYFHPLRFLVQLPLSHVFGQMMGLFIPPLLRAEMHFPGELNPADVADTVRKRRVSVLAAAPRYLEVLGAEIRRGSEGRWGVEGFAQRLARADSVHTLRRWWLFRDIHRRLGWKFWAFICGGASLPEETERLWRGLGYAVIQGYGMTETASLVSVNHPFKMSRGSIGKPMPGREIRIGEDGEVLVRGRNVSPGYWTKGGIEPLAEGAEWFATGDLARVDERGNLYFQGRSKDLIVAASGLNIVPEDVEEALRKEPEIRDAAVVGVEGQSGTEAFAMLIPGGAAEAADLKAAVERANLRLEAYQRVTRWAVWPGVDFPRTPTRKVRRAVVREVAQAAASGRGAVAVHADALEEVLWANGARWEGTLGDGMRLGADLGLDSLGRVQLLAALEGRFETRLDEAAFTETTTVRDLRAMLGATMGSAAEGMARRTGVEGSQDAAGARPERSAAELAGPQRGTASAAAPYPFADWPFGWWASAVRQVFSVLAMRPLARFFSGRAELAGMERLSALQGPVLFVANHVTAVDGALIAGRLPWRIARRLAIAMSGEMLRGYRHPAGEERWYWRCWLPVQYLLVVLVYAVFPLPRASGFRRAFEEAGRLADKGYSILVFPEGRRSYTGEIQPFEHGIGLLAKDLRLPVAPLRLRGLDEMRKSGRRVARRGELSLHVGQPLRFDAGEDAAEIARRLEEAVRAL